jgi:hypothetical protein
VIRDTLILGLPMTMMQQLGAMNRRFEVNQKSADFALILTLLAQTQNNHRGAAQIADVAKSIPDRVRAVLKTVAPGTSSDSAWAGPLAPYRPFADGFLQSIADRSIFDTAFPFMKPVPLKIHLVVASTASASIVAEANPAPVLQLSLARGSVDPVIAVAMLVITDDLARLGLGAAPLIEHELRRSVVTATDLQFITDITNGLSPIGSFGQTPSAFLQDLRALLGAVTSGDDAAFFLAVNPAIMKQLATATTMGGAQAYPTLGATGGTIAGVTVMPTAAATSGKMILFDAAQIGANSGTIIADTSKDGSVQMVTNPSGAAQHVSLFQTNSVAIKVWREFGYTLGRTGAAAMISGANYDDAQSGPI